MKFQSKPLTLYIGLLLIYSTFTLIATFFPGVAESKGVPLWTIGLIFSFCPFFNFLSSPFLGKYMYKIGRKTVLISSYVLTGISMLLLSGIELCDKPILISLGFLSRMIGGIGLGGQLNSVTTIFTSDYSDQVQLMIARMEAAIGFGLILGPIIGTALYYLSPSAGFTFIGASLLLYSPIASKILGSFRSYEISETSSKISNLLIKPKIYLSLIMSMACLFSFGFVEPILEIHLSGYKVPRLVVSGCFVMQSSVYFFTSMIAAGYLRDVDERPMMALGTVLLGVGYSMMGPCFIYPNEVWVVVAGLPLISMGAAFTYGKLYAVFSIPFMIKSATGSYGYDNDDILSDSISSYAVFSGACGEILGPIGSGVIGDILGIQTSCGIFAIISLTYSLVFLVFSGYLLPCRSQSRVGFVLNQTLVPSDFSEQTLK